jgi:hypothetical protein
MAAITDEAKSRFIARLPRYLNYTVTLSQGSSVGISHGRASTLSLGASAAKHLTALSYADSAQQIFDQDCGQTSQRDFFRIGALGLGGLALPFLLAADVHRALPVFVERGHRVGAINLSIEFVERTKQREPAAPRAQD